jgi:hypothetical protein
VACLTEFSTIRRCRPEARCLSSDQRFRNRPAHLPLGHPCSLEVNDARGRLSGALRTGRGFRNAPLSGQSSRGHLNAVQKSRQCQPEARALCASSARWDLLGGTWWQRSPGVALESPDEVQVGNSAAGCRADQDRNPQCASTAHWRTRSLNRPPSPLLDKTGRGSALVPPRARRCDRCGRRPAAAPRPRPRGRCTSPFHKVRR